MRGNQLFQLIIINILFSVSPLWSVAQQHSNPHNLVKMGIARKNITPADPLILSGYDARKTPSKGIHDSLFASAFFFTGTQNKALLIAADMIGFPFSFVDSVKSAIYSKTGIPLRNILLIATHDHGGPAIHTYEDQLPQVNEVYITSLKEMLVTLAIEATKNPQPFSVGIAKTRCDLNINRRAVFADGGVWLGRNPDGPCDHELDAIKFVDSHNNLIALLVNWPCHGTVMGQENYQITGDWPAAAARYLRKFSGKDPVVAVTAGASANINPIYGPGNDFNEVEAVGYHVAMELSKVLNQVKTAPVHSLQVRQASLTFPGKKGWTNQFPQPSQPTGTEVPVLFTGLKLDNIVLGGISGELMTEMGLQVKKSSPYPHTIILTHCNGLTGYICTDRAFTEGGYEPKVSHLMPGAEKLLVNKFLEMISTF